MMRLSSVSVSFLTRQRIPPIDTIGGGQLAEEIEDNFAWPVVARFLLSKLNGHPYIHM